MRFSSGVEHPTLDGLPLKDSVKSYAAMMLQHEPGTKYQYSNAGINTAARILEVVSGMPYEEFLQKRPLRPARDERHDVLAQRRAGEADCEVVQAGPRQKPAWKRPPSRS
jgi:CubicO group peptidase (beta-lactamase class C family)